MEIKLENMKTEALEVFGEQVKSLKLSDMMEEMENTIREAKPALKAFGIRYNDRKKTLTIKSNFDFKLHEEILGDYAEVINEMDFDKNSKTEFIRILGDKTRAKRVLDYYKKTDSKNAGEDAVQDYFSAYVTDILEILEKVIEKGKWGR